MALSIAPMSAGAGEAKTLGQLSLHNNTARSVTCAEQEIYDKCHGSR